MHARHASGNPETRNRTTMAESNKDDLADALSRLASGEAPSAPDGVPSEQVPLTPKTPRPQRPAAPGAPAVPPPTPTTSVPANAPSQRPNASGVQPPMPRPATT